MASTLRIRISVLVLAALAALTMLTASARAEVRAQRGCPAGYFCIYPSASWNNNVPSQKYFESIPVPPGYTWWNLSGQYGTHRLFNNTYCAGVRLDKHYGGGSPYSPIIWEGKSYDWSLTAANSITMSIDSDYSCHGAGNW